MKRRVRTILMYSLGGLLAMVMIAFSTKKNSALRVKDVTVKISDQHGNFFTDQLEVLGLLNGENTDYVLGLSVGALDLKELEHRVEKHPFVKDAQVYRDISGHIVVKVTQAYPIARIFDPQGPDWYIDMEGNLLPTSVKHTARVPVIEMARKFGWEKNICETEYGIDLLETLRFIERDEFWRAQVAGLVIAKNGELTLLPQVTKQEVKFGMPDAVESKFRKLKIFYKEILPNKGWNTYSVVNVKFKNQIVCE